MKLTFQHTHDDSIAFQLDKAANSTDYIRRCRICRLSSTIGVLIISVIGCWIVDNSTCGLLAAMPVVSYVLWPSYFRLAYKKSLQRVIKRNCDGGFSELSVIEIQDDGLHAHSFLGKAFHELSDIGDIAESGIYTYIYVSKDDAIILPNDRIPQEQIDAFVAELKVRIEASKDSSESPAPDGDS